MTFGTPTSYAAFKATDLSKSSFPENVHVINPFDAEDSNQVQIELDLYFLIFVLL